MSMFVAFGVGSQVKDKEKVKIFRYKQYYTGYLI